MQLYYFNLKVGYRTIPDVEGQELADDAAAREHAVAISKELMRNRENETRYWRIQICDDYLQPRFDVLFAEVDLSLARFDSRLQVSIEHVVRRKTALNDAVVQMRATLNDVKKTLESAEQILFLVSRAPLP